MKRMELRGTAFKEGNGRYDNAEVIIDSNFLTAKERRLLEGLALMIRAYHLSAEGIAQAVKDSCKQILDSMVNDDGFWSDVYGTKMLEARMNYYREVISELESLIECL